MTLAQPILAHSRTACKEHCSVGWGSQQHMRSNESIYPPLRDCTKKVPLTSHPRKPAKPFSTPTSTTHWPPCLSSTEPDLSHPSSKIQLRICFSMRFISPPPSTARIKPLQMRGSCLDTSPVSHSTDEPSRFMMPAMKVMLFQLSKLRFWSAIGGAGFSSRKIPGTGWASPLEWHRLWGCIKSRLNSSLRSADTKNPSHFRKTYMGLNEKDRKTWRRLWWMVYVSSAPYFPHTMSDVLRLGDGYQLVHASGSSSSCAGETLQCQSSIRR